jgi:hypothetical protein
MYPIDDKLRGKSQLKAVEMQAMMKSTRKTRARIAG